jgi:hypothetical protein
LLGLVVTCSLGCPLKLLFEAGKVGLLNLISSQNAAAIMPSTASFKDPKVYHILTYGTLLGSNLFQTFLGGPLAFKALPRPSFSTLQQAIFPPYFTFQAALPVLLALTWPGEKLAQVGGRELTQNSGFWGIFSENNLMTAGVPVFLMFATSAANLLVFGPATTKVMKERKHQGMMGGRIAAGRHGEEHTN